MRKYTSLLFLFSIFILGCTHKENSKNEDKEAKNMLQGLWIAEENNEPILIAKGDSILFPDSASVPVYFWVNKDSLFIEGNNLNRYKIFKQTETYIELENRNKETISLKKSENKDLLSAFDYHIYAMNTFAKHSADTLVKTDLGYIECKINTETSSDKVIKSTYNDIGIEIDNTYLDNVVRIELRNDSKQIYLHEFRKVEFEEMIGKTFIKKSQLKEINFTHTDHKALYFNALIGIPDAATSYVIQIRITPDGKVTKQMT